MKNREKRTALRRKDRGVTDDERIREILNRYPVGVFGNSVTDQPFLNTNLFVYSEEDHAIFFHTARTGQTRDIIEKNARTCFSVFDLGRLLPADTALEFSAEFVSVTAFGTVSILEDRAEARRALQKLLDRYAPHLKPGVDYAAITDEELARTTAFKLAIEEWVGKEKHESPDFPGAFRFGATGAGGDGQ